MELTIKNISSKQKQGAKGPYTMLGLQFEEKGDQWVNGYGNATTSRWVKGQRLTVGKDITFKTVEKDGKTFYNFETPKTENQLVKRIEELEKRVSALEGGPQSIGQSQIYQTPYDIDANSVTAEDEIPF